MANTSARMLRLLSLLQTYRYWPGTDLADRLEVSARTLRRDVERLRELGYPVAASRGIGGGYQLKAGTALPPLLLDDDEAVAIAVGLRTAAAGAVAGIEELSVRALAKVVQVMPPRLRRRVEAVGAYTVPAVLSGPTVDAGLLTLIAQACRGEERLRFRYEPRDAEPAVRLVEPHRLVSIGRRWYLLAWDAERHDWRSFRVDRISAPESTGHRFRPRDVPGGDAAAFVQGRLAAIQSRYQVRVRVFAPVADVERMVGQWGTVEPVDGSTCELRMTVDSLDWPVMTLVALAARFEIVEPPELAERVKVVAEFLTGAAAGPVGSAAASATGPAGPTVTGATGGRGRRPAGRPG
jgi:predicted DNA-binding transcriptional regulator YafY